MKRGSIQDLAAVFIVILVLVLSLFVLNKLNTAIGETIINNTNSSGELTALNNTTTPASINYGNNAFGLLIGAIPAIIILTGLASVILAYLIPTSPVFIIYAILMWLVYIATGGMFSNLLHTFLTAEEFAATANQYGILVWMIDNLPLVATIYGALIILVLFSRRGGE